MKKEVKLARKIKLLLKQLNQREYLHHFGPKKYKLFQHIFALMLMQICKMSFRRVENFSVLLDVKVPTYSALCKSRKRIDSKNPVKRYAKLSAFFDLPTRKFIALKIRVKPRHDVKDIDYLLNQS